MTTSSSSSSSSRQQQRSQTKRIFQQYDGLPTAALWILLSLTQQFPMTIALHLAQEGGKSDKALLLITPPTQIQNDHNVGHQTPPNAKRPRGNGIIYQRQHIYRDLAA